MYPDDDEQQTVEVPVIHRIGNTVCAQPIKPQAQKPDILFYTLYVPGQGAPTKHYGNSDLDLDSVKAEAERLCRKTKKPVHIMASILICRPPTEEPPVLWEVPKTSS